MLATKHDFPWLARDTFPAINSTNRQKVEYQYTNTPSNDKYKHEISKTLRNRQFCTCFLCVSLRSFSEFWQTENAISAHGSFCLRDLYSKNSGYLEVSIRVAI
jgi:hypothetical protein